MGQIWPTEHLTGLHFHDQIHSHNSRMHPSCKLRVKPPIVSLLCLFLHSDPETRETRETRETGLDARFHQDQSPANPHPFHYPTTIQPQAPLHPQPTGAAQHAPSPDPCAQAAVQPPAAGTPFHPTGSSEACGGDGRGGAAWVHPQSDRPQRLGGLVQHARPRVRWRSR